ncbi:MAG: pyridoxamine 5'-phosphate oxidase [Acidobacteria bacterium]|nr:pyridoxamine 5'-phosphate oxidase [Acidobacteriota bacterium]
MPELKPHAEPFDRFRELLGLAEASGLADPNAMTLTTVGEDGFPSSRMVLLKSVDEEGFVFYTNLESRKGRQILAHPKASLTFFWRPLDVQVHVEGEARQVSDEEADAYFATRPRGSQLGAWASRQSRPMKGRAELLAEVAKVEARYLARAVPRPPHWSGFRVVPRRIEFWKAGTFRLHHRELYEPSGDGWTVTVLFP